MTQGQSISKRIGQSKGGNQLNEVINRKQATGTKPYRARRGRKISRGQIKFLSQSNEFKLYTKYNGKPWDGFTTKIDFYFKRSLQLLCDKMQEWKQ